MESNDRLNLQNDKDIEKLIPFEIGTILNNLYLFYDTYSYLQNPFCFQRKSSKSIDGHLNKREYSSSLCDLSTSSERNVIFPFIHNHLTNKIYIELRKKLLIEDLGSVIKSLLSSEFILHFPNFFDLRLQCERRDDFLNLIKLRFAHL